MTQTTSPVLSPDSVTPGDENALIPSVPVERIVGLRNSGAERFMQGMALIREAQALFLQASGRDWFYGLGEIVDAGLKSSRSAIDDESIRRRMCRLIDQYVWERLMRDTGMFTLMSAAQKKQWDSDLYSDHCPEISMDSVLATFRQLNASKGETFELGVIDVFRTLSWDYKTNNPCFLGKRIILDAVVDSFQGSWFSVRSHGQARINDLARPFWVLDGKNVPDFRVSEGARLGEFISASAENLGEVFTCEYFSLRAFKKGSVHITFTRPDLVDKVNDIVARHYPGALPPAV